MSQKIAWGIFAVVVLPLLVTGVKVWSTQESNPLQYATKAEVQAYERKVIKTETLIEAMQDDVSEIKASQNEMRNDIKELLRR